MTICGTWSRRIQPAGFILFKRNVEDPEQVRELNRELASLSEAGIQHFEC